MTVQIDGFVMPTVRHTGSLFFAGIFERAGFERVTLRGEAKRHSMVFDHLYDQHMPHFYRWIDRFPLVLIPLRDPQAVARGWAKRGEKFEHFWAMWRNLALLEDFIPEYLPLDTEDRDVHLDRVSGLLGVELSTDWAPVNTSQAELSEPVPDVSELYDWPVVSRFYTKERSLCDSPM